MSLLSCDQQIRTSFISFLNDQTVLILLLTNLELFQDLGGTLICIFFTRLLVLFAPFKFVQSKQPRADPLMTASNLKSIIQLSKVLHAIPRVPTKSTIGLISDFDINS